MASEFQKEINKTRQCSIWFIWIVILANIPGLINVIQGVMFLIDPDTLSVRCEIPGLKNINWTFDQIKNISDPGYTIMPRTPIHEFVKIQ